MKNLCKKLKINAQGHKDIDFIDVSFARDTKLFLDPCLIETGETEWCKKASKTMTSFFDELYCRYREPKRGRSVYQLLQHLGERNEARLGYGNGDNGKGNTADGMMDILAEVPELIAKGIQMEDPIDLPLFLSDFAEDGMSDMLINILFKDLSDFTLQQCQKYGIKTIPIDTERYYWDYNTLSWQLYSGDCLRVDGKLILMIPKNIVRTRYYYNTSQYFRSMIVSRIKKEKTEYVDGKAVAPKIQDIFDEECQEYGSVKDAACYHTTKTPSALSLYHANMFNAYGGKSMTDKALDDFIYGVVEE